MCREPECQKTNEGFVLRDDPVQNVSLLADNIITLFMFHYETPTQSLPVRDMTLPFQPLISASCVKA